MEGNEDEDDIWDEKSLTQLKRKLENPLQKRGKSLSTRTHKNAKKYANEIQGSSHSGHSETSQTMKLEVTNDSSCGENSRKANRKRKRSDSSSNRNVGSRITTSTQRNQCNSAVSNDKVTPQKEIMDGCCPKCQMPFSTLIGQSPGWHVMECLETKYSYIGMVPILIEAVSVRIFNSYSLVGIQAPK